MISIQQALTCECGQPSSDCHEPCVLQQLIRPAPDYTCLMTCPSAAANHSELRTALTIGLHSTFDRVAAPYKLHCMICTLTTCHGGDLCW